MNFNHTPYQPGETIAAISTPPGEGGISIIRLSGSRALEIGAKIFSGPLKAYKTHTAHLGVVRDNAGNRLDEALALVMHGPRSYTGEDTVELQCHGGMIAAKKVLEAAIAAGARIALPGEFTLKAFMNGKLDLAQAEAVQKLISAKNEQAFAAAGTHLEGNLSKKIKEYQNQLIRLSAILEAWVDFPEEGIEFATQEEIIAELHALSQEMESLLATFEDGKKIEQGIALCIAGPPNAGKSSLMNALLDQERAIVTPIAGTTRDLLHEELTIGGLHFRLTDTAGIRETGELVEREGIKRSKGAIQSADVIFLVLDATQPPPEEERAFFENLPPEKTILLWNKTDLDHPPITISPFPMSVKISAKERLGLHELKEKLQSLIWQKGAPAKDEVIITTLRHKEALTASIAHLKAVIEGLGAHISPEFLSADLRTALSELGKMIGVNVGEEILSSIFSQFCIGK